jgi:hypothetical protein
VPLALAVIEGTAHAQAPQPVCIPGTQFCAQGDGNGGVRVGGSAQGQAGPGGANASATANEIASEHDQKVYRPEVLTDDNSSSSMIPTIIFAGIILALMTGGILFAINYLQTQDTPAVNTAVTNTNSNSGPGNTATVVTPPVGNAPSMATVKIDFRAAADAISLTSTTDGKKASATVASGTSVMFEPKESLKLSYYKALSQSAQLSINGKSIVLPEAPENPRRNAIEFETNAANLAKIWTEGRITYDVPAAPDANANVAVNAANAVQVPTRPAATPLPRPTATVARPPATNTAPSNAVTRPTPN